MIANAPTAPASFAGTEGEFNLRLSAEARLDTAAGLLGLDEGLEKVAELLAIEAKALAINGTFLVARGTFTRW